MNVSMVTIVGVGLFLRFCAGAATPAVVLDTLNQAEAHAKFPGVVQKQFRATVPFKTSYSALKTVAHDGQLYIIYSSIFPNVFDKAGITATCSLVARREAAKYVLLQSEKLQVELRKFRFGAQVFGSHPPLSLLRIAKVSFPGFLRFDLRIDDGNTAVVTAVVPLLNLKIKSLELAKHANVMAYYLKCLRESAALYVERQRNYPLAIKLLQEARHHGDESADLLLLLHQAHVAQGNTGPAHDALKAVSTQFLSLITAKQCEALSQHASGFCDEISAGRWQDYAQEKRFRLLPPAPKDR